MSGLFGAKTSGIAGDIFARNTGPIMKHVNPVYFVKGENYEIETRKH